MNETSYLWYYVAIIWILLGHTYGVIKIYKFGFMNNETEIDIDEQKLVYRYLRILKPILRKPIPEPSTDSRYYYKIRKYYCSTAIIWQTLITITIVLYIIHSIV